MDTISTLILAGSLIIIMLGMGLSLVMDDFKRIIIYPKAILIGLVNQLILLPIIGLLIVFAFPVSTEIAIGLMILAACPGGPTSNLIAHLAKGDTALSVSLTAISSLITIITIPLIVNLSLELFTGAGQVVRLNVIETISKIFVIIVFPVSLGMTIRRFFEKFALNMEKPVRIASAFVIALVIIGIVVKERTNFIPYFQQAGIAALVLNVATMAVGYLSARIFKIVDRRAISISIESGIQNGTMAITIAVVLLGNSQFAIAPAIYSLLMFFTGGIAIYMGMQKDRVLVQGV